jgi:hypothetical protein
VTGLVGIVSNEQSLIDPKYKNYVSYRVVSEMNCIETASRSSFYFIAKKSSVIKGIQVIRRASLMLVFTDVLMTDGAVPYSIVSSADYIENAANKLRQNIQG